MSALGQKRTFWNVRTMSALPPKADIRQPDRHVRFVPEAGIHPRALGEHPSTITDDLVARASGITGVAQRHSSSFQVAAVRFDKEASYRQEATRLAWTQTRPVTVFYGRSGRRIQAPGGLITVIVRQVGADNE